MHKHCCTYCKRPSTKYTPVSHVIFDLDGTIINSEPVYIKAVQYAVESCGGKYEADFMLKVQGCIEQDVAKIAVAYFNLPCTEKEFLAKFNEYANKFLGDLELMPGAERIIRNLHRNNVPICIATSSSRASFDLKTKKFQDLITCFDHIVCGGTDPEITHGKPAPDIFLVAASRFHPPGKPKRCLVFEDSVNGLKAGIAAGMQVVLIPESQISYEEWKLATIRLDSFNYMVPELFNLPGYPQNEVAKELAGTTVPEVGIDANGLVQSLGQDLMLFGQQLARNFGEYQQRFGRSITYYEMNSSDSEFSFEENRWDDDRFDSRGEFGWDLQKRNRDWMGMGEEMKDSPYTMALYENVRQNAGQSLYYPDGSTGWPQWERNLPSFDGVRENSPYVVTRYQDERYPYAITNYSGEEKEPHWDYESANRIGDAISKAERQWPPHRYYEDGDGKQWTRDQQYYESGHKTSEDMFSKDATSRAEAGRWQWPQWDKNRKGEDTRYYETQKAHDDSGGRMGGTKDPRFYEGDHRVPDSFVRNVTGRSSKPDWQWPQWERDRKDIAGPSEQNRGPRYYGRPNDARTFHSSSPKDWQWPQWERDSKDPRYYESSYKGVPEDAFGGSKSTGASGKNWQWPEWEREKTVQGDSGGRMGGARDTRFYDGSPKAPKAYGEDAKGRSGKSDWRWPQWERERQDANGQKQPDESGKAGSQWPQWDRQRKDNGGTSGKRDPHYYDGALKNTSRFDEVQSSPHKDWQWPQSERDRKEKLGYYQGEHKRVPEDADAFGGNKSGKNWQWPEWEREKKSKDNSGARMGETRDPRFYDGSHRGPESFGRDGNGRSGRPDWQWPQWDRQRNDHAGTDRERDPHYYERVPKDSVPKDATAFAGQNKNWQWPQWERTQGDSGGRMGGTRDPRFYDGNRRAPETFGRDAKGRSGKPDWQKRDINEQRDFRHHEEGRTPANAMGGKAAFQWPQWERERREKANEDSGYYKDAHKQAPSGDAGVPIINWQWPQWEREKKIQEDLGGRMGGARDPRFYDGSHRAPEGFAGSRSGKPDWQWPQWERERKQRAGEDPHYYKNGHKQAPRDAPGKNWQWPQWERDKKVQDNSRGGMNGRDPRFYDGSRKPPEVFDGNAKGRSEKPDWQWPQWERERQDHAGPSGQRDLRHYKTPEDTRGSPHKDWQWPQWERERKEKSDEDPRYYEGGRRAPEAFGEDAKGRSGKPDWQWSQSERDATRQRDFRYYEGGKIHPGSERDPRYYEEARSGTPKDTSTFDRRAPRKDWQWPQWERDRKEKANQDSHDYNNETFGGNAKGKSGKPDWQWPQWEREKRDFDPNGRPPTDAMGGPGKAGWQWPQWDRQRNDNIREKDPRYYQGTPKDTRAPDSSPRKDWQWPQWEREQKNANEQRQPGYEDRRAPESDRAGWQWPQWDRQRNDNASPSDKQKNPRYYEGARKTPQSAIDEGKPSSPRKDFQWPQWEKDANKQKHHENKSAPEREKKESNKKKSITAAEGRKFDWPKWEREANDETAEKKDTRVGRRRKKSEESPQKVQSQSKKFDWPKWDKTATKDKANEDTEKKDETSIKWKWRKDKTDNEAISEQNEGTKWPWKKSKKDDEKLETDDQKPKIIELEVKHQKTEDKTTSDDKNSQEADQKPEKIEQPKQPKYFFGTKK